MTIIENYFDRSPEQAKRIIGINIDQFQELVKWFNKLGEF